VVFAMPNVGHNCYRNTSLILWFGCATGVAFP
jgi:hypothetical protein